MALGERLPRYKGGLLEILQGRCEEVGVSLRFQAEVRDEAGLARHSLADADVVVAADGVQQRLAGRSRRAARAGSSTPARRSTIWLGTSLPLDAFTFYFVENAHGVFQAHCYRFDAGTSTFDVGMPTGVVAPRRFDAPGPTATVAACERLFRPLARRHRLRSDTSPAAPPWTAWCGCATASRSTAAASSSAMPRTPRISRSGRHQARHRRRRHAGAGARSPKQLTEAFAEYQRGAVAESLRLQNAARNSMESFEHVDATYGLAPDRSPLAPTRSPRVSHQDLRLPDRDYLAHVERWFAPASAPRPASLHGADVHADFSLRGMTVANRVVVAPMDVYRAGATGCRATFTWYTSVYPAIDGATWSSPR